MARSAAKNPDRHRIPKEFPMPPDVARMVEPGAKAYTMGPCNIIVGKQKLGWHMTISRPNKLPSWEEVRDVRYALIPDDVVMVMILPPRSDYVNVHEFCLQLYEVPPEYLENIDTL